MTNPSYPPGVSPTPHQLRWQAAEFGMFCHFGINTFYGKEWSDGTLDPRGFDPARLDARQWVATATHAGMRYLILTAKHHDGFCLWQTDTTDYGVRSSPYKGGKGDVVAELAEACREAGMPLGLYLSPWDRHEPCYPDPEAYDRFYTRQLTELCTRYGPLFELWFDGAGSEGRSYDWDSIMDVARTHQPDAMIFNMGRPTIRWAGNEDGVCDDPNFYVTDETAVSAFTHDTQGAGEAPRYLPPECDVALRRNWFWQPDDLDTLKTTDHLLGIYYRSVGRGANLLLNVPPDRDGLISPEDGGRLREMADELKKRFAAPLPATLARESETATLVRFAAPAAFDHLVLEEYLTGGQRIDGYRVTAGPEGRVIAEGRTVGHKKIHTFALEQGHHQLRVERATPGGGLARVTAYHTGHEQPPELAAQLDYGAWARKADLPAKETKV